MVVKSAFLNSLLEGEVYVKQPLGFESEKYPHRVYKLRKVLYGLKQAPRAWYDRLKGLLFERGFEMGNVDQTLFLLKKGKDILIVQVYQLADIFTKPNQATFTHLRGGLGACLIS
jgi:hypothetical protein